MMIPARARIIMSQSPKPIESLEADVISPEALSLR
jgi:hypothetical protein